MEYIRKNRSVLVPVLGLVFVLAFFGIISKGAIFQGSNLATIINQAFTTIMVSVGLSLIYAQGGIDFSPGGVIALCSMTAMTAIELSGSLAVSLIVCIATGIACYLVTGTITVHLNLNPYIGTVAMMSLTRGIVNSVLQSKMYSPADFGIANHNVFRFVILVLVIVLCFVVFNRTKLGRVSQAYGENAVAASQTGMPLKRYRLLAFCFGGAIVGLAAFFLLARTSNVSTGTGMNEEMNVIIALALGGMAMNGGVRTAIRCGVIGGIIISVLVNGMVIVGVPLNLTHGVRGVIFLIVVAISYARDTGSKLLPR